MRTNRARAGLLLLTVLSPVWSLAACGDGGTGPADEPFEMAEVEFAPELGVDLSEMEHLGQQLYVEDLELGDGITAQSGDSVFVHYTGWLPDGTEFDSNHDPDAPLAFVLGAGRLIPGWEIGVEGMRPDGVRLLVIPPDLAYGEAGAGGVIPPNSALVFEVEVVGIVRP